MDAFHTLMENYSLEGIILLVVLLVVFVKFFGEALEWIIKKFKSVFNIKSHKDVERDKLSDKIDDADTKLNEMDNTIHLMNECFESRMKENNSAIQMLREQVQQSARAYIMERHHHFCYTVGAIDDHSLQMLEIRFAYYKSQGGNSFIDRQMEELRGLPRISAENAAIIAPPTDGGSL